MKQDRVFSFEHDVFSLTICQQKEKKHQIFPIIVN